MNRITKNNAYRLHPYTLYCGETGIRTPGASQHNGFQDRRNRPLCHLSNTVLLFASLLKRCKGTDIF